MALLVFMRWVISYANEEEDYFDDFQEGAGIPRIEPQFDLLQLALELSRCWWVSHLTYANILQ